MSTTEAKRKAIIDDWFDSCRSDAGFMRSILQGRAASMTDEEVAEAYADAFDGLNGG